MDKKQLAIDDYLPAKQHDPAGAVGVEAEKRMREEKPPAPVQ